MPVVVPLSEKPAEEREHCEHIAWEVTGHITPRPGETKAQEHRKCSDCGYRWHAEIEVIPQGDSEPTAVPKPPTPPGVAYAHAQIVTYKAGERSFDVLIEETAIVSVQNGVLVLQHPEGEITGITGVRPWLREVTDAPAAD